MGGYEELIAGIKAVVRRNGRREITGDALQQVLVGMVSAIGANSAFAGVANPETDPGNPDANVFWIAATPGTYTHFGNAAVTASAILSNETGEWVATPLGFGGGSDKTVPEFDLITTKSKSLRRSASVDEYRTIDEYPLALQFYGSAPEGEAYADFFTVGRRRGKRMILAESVSLAELERSPVGLMQDRLETQCVYLGLYPSDLIGWCISNFRGDFASRCQKAFDTYKGDIDPNLQPAIRRNGCSDYFNFFSNAGSQRDMFASVPMACRLRIAGRTGPACNFRAALIYASGTGEYRFTILRASNGRFNGFVYP